jgi:hypothetical protein
MLTPGNDAGTSSLLVSASPAGPVVCPGACVALSAQAAGGKAPYSYKWSNGLVSDGGAVTACPSATTTYTVTATDSSGSAGEFTSASLTGTAKVIVTVSTDCSDGGPEGTASDGGAPATTEDAGFHWAHWTDLSDAGTATTPGTVVGQLLPPSGAITVTYVGEVVPPTGLGAIQGFATQPPSSMTNFFDPTSTYTSPTVATPPNASIIVQRGGTTLVDTLTFSRAVTNPVFAIVSLGDYQVDLFCTYTFGAYGESFTILQMGPGHFAGPGTMADIDGGLTAADGDGLVQLNGTFTTIQWMDPVGESPGAHGFTIGIAGP